MGKNVGTPKGTFKQTDNAKQKMRNAWVERTETFVPPMKGKEMDAGSRRKMSEAATKRASNRKGKKHTLASRIKISKITRERTPRGAQCHSFKDGRHAERMGQRHSLEYKRWRFNVYSRDNFTCQNCGDSRGGNLHAHHIKPYADYPESRFEINNGITLCQKCHKAIHAANGEATSW